MTEDDDDDYVRKNYAARELERQRLAGPTVLDEQIDQRLDLELDPDLDRDLDEDELATRERMRRRIEEEYNRNRFGIDDDDRVGRVWGGDDDELENQPTGVIRTAGLPPPEEAELRYIPGRARMRRDDNGV
ncbi:MAG: hypothetical protein SFX73_02175 [Kofleriaceae bacterium]|nr:hypothetical protein [Kofleriaceae bacterium]